MDDQNVKTDDSAGTESQSNAGKTFTQAELENIIKDRLKRQKDAIDAQKAKEKDDADKAALADQQQFKALAEKHEARVKELEPVEAKATRYADVLGKYLTEQRKGLSAPVLKLLDKMDVAEQLEWIVENKAEITKAQAPNLNAGDKGKDLSKDERQKAMRESLQKSGQYSSF